MSLLANAVSSIEVGVADLHAGDPARVVSALRNLHAGVLLLIKEVLRDLSPPETGEVLLKQNIKPVLVGGKLAFVGSGKKTVETRQMEERCESLGIKLDWARIKRVGNLRNSAEHYYVNVSQAAIRAAMTESFLVIRDVVTNHLKRDAAELFSSATWQAFLSDSEVHAAEKATCESALRGISWGSVAVAEAIFGFSCGKCGSALLIPGPDQKAAPDIHLICRSCSETYAFDDIVEALLEDHFAAESYLAMTDGADEPLTDCPFCMRHAYIMTEERCGACLERARHQCEVCAGIIPASELDESGICGYCRHKIEKARDE
jgi:hypothetical protein